jgi:hypothetical protein
MILLYIATTLFSLVVGFAASPTPASGGCAVQSFVPGFTCIDFTASDGNKNTVFINTAHSVSPSTTQQSRDLVGGSWGYMNDDQDDCGTSTWIDMYNAGSPWSADCDYLRQFAREAKGRFYINDRLQQTQHWTPLLYNSGCAFVTTSPGNPSAQGYYVGNSDIADIVEDGVLQHTQNYKVEGLGDMSCTSGGAAGVPVRFWVVSRNGIPTT